MEKVKRDFCINCRKETDIVWGKAKRTTNIKGKPFDYLETVAICKECGQEMSPHGLIDLNIKELEEQYQYSKIINFEENKYKPTLENALKLSNILLICIS